MSKRRLKAPRRERSLTYFFLRVFLSFKGGKGLAIEGHGVGPKELDGLPSDCTGQG